MLGQQTAFIVYLKPLNYVGAITLTVALGDSICALDAPTTQQLARAFGFELLEDESRSKRTIRATLLTRCAGVFALLSNDMSRSRC